MQPYWRERSKQGEQSIDRVRVGQDAGTGWLGSRAAKGIALAAGEPHRPRNGVTVAVHANRDLPEGTLRAILRRAGLSREDFEILRRG